MRGERGSQRRRPLPRLAIQPSARHISIMMQPNLTPDEHAALIELLRDTIDRDRFPMSPRMKLLRSILEKLGIRSTLLGVSSLASKPRSRLGAVLLARKRRL